jgi:predicted nucleotidyltransferase
MNKTLLNLSGKIDSSTINALLEIANIAAKLKLDFFIIGATARDIVMECVHNIKAPRITKDIDIAVCLADWNEFRALADELAATGKLLKLAQIQRYDFDGVLIDILPFGDISRPDNKICWPPYYDKVVSTIGFDDVYKTAITLRLNNEPVLDIKVPTIPGLAIMKLIAWNEAYPDRKKDAEDLLFIMRAYQHAGIEDRLYDQETRLLMEEEFDNERSGIRLLGRDMARISNAETANTIKEILGLETGEKSKYRLVSQMGNIFDDPDYIMFILEKFKQGFIEGIGF